MSRQYVENRIKEALKKSRGNTHLAQQQIIAWTYEDAKLLHYLARPHLDGIVAYNIERLLSSRAQEIKNARQGKENISLPKSGGKPSDAAGASSKKPQVGARGKGKPEEFGMDILKAVAASDAAVFGFENNSPQSKRKQASKRHIDALQKMAASSSAKDKDIKHS